MMTFIRLTILLPVSFVFALLVETRRLLYSFIFQPKKLKPVVISVGNLTSGGTGKTPFVLEILSLLAKTGKSVVVVSRSYKIQQKIMARVQVGPNAAELYGDEPSLIAQKFPQVPVFIGPNKLETCLEVERQMNPDIILIDDGFQHIRLHRDVDIVLIDVTEPRWHYLPLPSGYGRDALWQLDRAAIIVLTKENLAEPQQREFARSLVSTHTNVIGMDYKLGDIYRIADHRQVQISDFNNEPILLVSGIGRPKTFYSLLATEMPITIVGHVEFKDHHAYTDQDLQKILKTAAELKAKHIFVTEKDAIKLKVLIEDKLEFMSVGLQPRVKDLERALKKEGIL